VPAGVGAGLDGPGGQQGGRREPADWLQVLGPVSKLGSRRSDRPHRDAVPTPVDSFLILSHF
jgi:hypothetical protein